MFKLFVGLSLIVAGNTLSAETAKDVEKKLNLLQSKISEERLVKQCSYMEKMGQKLDKECKEAIQKYVNEEQKRMELERKKVQ